MFDEFIGQPRISRILQAHIEACKIREELPRHMLFTGPPGLGKTHLSELTARELGYIFVSTAGRNLTSYSKLTEFIGESDEPVIYFIDEIHGMNLQASEGLYHIMQNGVFADEIATEDADKLQLVIIGATTDSGAMPKPLRDRFSYIFQFQFYSVEDLEKIVKELAGDDAYEIAKRSLGTPRIALRIANQVRDFKDTGVSSLEEIFDILGIDAWGFDENARAILNALREHKRLSLDSIAALTGISVETLYHETEPYLLRSGIVLRGSRGRELNYPRYLEYLKEVG